MDQDQAHCARYHIEVLAAQMRSAGADERMLASLRAEYVATAMTRNDMLKDVARYSRGRGSEVTVTFAGASTLIDAGDLTLSVQAAADLLVAAECAIEREALAAQVQALQEQVRLLKERRDDA